MPITRREAKEIVDWVIQEINRRRFPYVTDGRLDLSKSPVGTISGTPTAGGPIAEGAIYDRHVHPNADVRGTKVRVATSSERGTVQLADDGEAIVPTASGLGSTASGYGASLVGIEDVADNFVGTDVEAALAELASDLGAATFVGLEDTPISYGDADQVPFITESEDALEFRHVDYFDGGTLVLSEVAVGDSVDADSEFDSNYIAEYGNNGNESDRWSSVSVDEPHWWRVDLGRATDIREVRILWEGAYPVAYKIQYSSNDSDWYDAADDGASASGWVTTTFYPISARYWRMWTDSQTQEGHPNPNISFYEAEFYSAEDQYAGGVEINRDGADGGSFTKNAILDGGSF